MGIYILIGSLGLVTGLLAGLVGIGGGIVMAPLLLYVPQLFGFEPLPMRVVAGLTIVQGLVACISGAITHHHFRFVSGQLCLVMGISIFVAALIGSIGAAFVSNEILLFIFACLAFTASIFMLLTTAEETEGYDVEQVSFNSTKAVVTAISVGLLGGLVGQGGSFILIPLMIYFVKIPTRIAIGSNLAIVIFSSIAGFIGKAASGQIEWLLAIPIVLTVIPATFLGSLLSRRTPVLMLKRILSLLIALAACKMWWSIAHVLF